MGYGVWGMASLYFEVAKRLSGLSKILTFVYIIQNNCLY